MRFVFNIYSRQCFDRPFRAACAERAVELLNEKGCCTNSVPQLFNRLQNIPPKKKKGTGDESPVPSDC